MRQSPVSEVFRCQAVQTFTWGTTSSIAETKSGNYFTVGGLNLATALGALFDQYRVTRLQVLITPPAGNTTETALWASAVDLDDSAAPTSLATLCGKPGVLVSMLNQQHYHDFVPGVAEALYNGAFTGYGQREGGWIDCANMNVQLYGVKSAVGITSASLTIQCTVVFDLEFRGISNN